MILSSTDPNVFNGTIDEFAIWNRSLSDSEIEDIYLRGAVALNLSVRSCDDDACDTETWNSTGNNASFENISDLNIKLTGPEITFSVPS